MKTTILTKELALIKIKQYCAYQERCQAEVKEKLYSLNLFDKAADEIISQLITENYLNEERFAIQFAGGRFRMKQWGRVKIKHALKQKQVSGYCIEKALNQIAEADYKKTLKRLAEQKSDTLKNEKNISNKKRKLCDYLLKKGYESILVKKITDLTLTPVPKERGLNS